MKHTFKTADITINSTYAKTSSKYTDGFFGSFALSNSNQPFNATVYKRTCSKVKNAKTTAHSTQEK